MQIENFFVTQSQAFATKRGAFAPNIQDCLKSKDYLKNNKEALLTKIHDNCFK